MSRTPYQLALDRFLAAIVKADSLPERHRLEERMAHYMRCFAKGDPLPPLGLDDDVEIDGEERTV